MTPQDLFDYLYEKKNAYSNWLFNGRKGLEPEHFQPAAYAELAKDTTFYDCNQQTHVTTERTVKAGTTVKIVMVSRFGDFGITDDLSRVNGYQCRVGADSGMLVNCRAER